MSMSMGISLCRGAGQNPLGARQGEAFPQSKREMHSNEKGEEEGGTSSRNPEPTSTERCLRQARQAVH